MEDTKLNHGLELLPMAAGLLVVATAIAAAGLGVLWALGRIPTPF